MGWGYGTQDGEIIQLEELCPHFLLGSLNYLIRAGTGSPGSTPRIWAYVENGFATSLRKTRGTIHTQDSL